MSPRGRSSGSWPLSLHIALLAVFALAALGLWMLPSLLAGFPYVVSALIPRARDFAGTGVIGDDPMRLMTLMLGALARCLQGKDPLVWHAVGATGFAAALVPWWFAVRRLFDVRVAWASLVPLAFMPMFWIEAVRLEGYSFAFLFLFLGIALFLRYQKRQPLLAYILAGACFGLTAACRDAFLILLPWTAGAFLWHGRSAWKRATVRTGVFCVVAYVAFTLPLLPDALQEGLSPVERAAVLLPSLENRTPGEGHLYPDAYAYEFLREEFDRRIVERSSGASFLEREQERNYRYLFGVGEHGPLQILFNGAWLTVNALPEIVSVDTVGGALVWVFVLIGMVACYRQRRLVLLEWIGLWLSTELILRFVLHFSRSHLTDIGWGLALFAGLGIVSMADALQRGQKRITGTTIAAALALLLFVQLVQVNRKQFASFYARSSVLEMYAATEALNALPDDVVVAHPRRADLFYLSDRRSATLHPETIDLLAEQGKVGDALAYYGVTHMIAYDDERAALIRAADPDVQTVVIPEHPPTVVVTPFLQYLLHQIR